MSLHPILKHHPEDFRVRENIVTTLTDRANATQQYLLLRKCGYTTFEAVRLIAAFLRLPPEEVAYAGLKDEDAVTEQLISVPVSAVGDSIGARDCEIAATSSRWARISHYGYGKSQLEVGKLDGNSFRITLRNISLADAQVFTSTRKFNLIFLNYYDTQRFGVPGGRKRNHHIGAAMLAGDWESALYELIGSHVPESNQAATWKGSAEGFFQTLDSRNAGFYLSAYSSHRWNDSLKEVVAGITRESLAVEIDGIIYSYLPSSRLVAELLRREPELTYDRYAFDHGSWVVTRTSMRPTVVQAIVSVTDYCPDELIQGKYKSELSFMLPSGCYATSAVRQLLVQLDRGEPVQQPSKSAL